MKRVKECIELAISLTIANKYFQYRNIEFLKEKFRGREQNLFYTILDTILDITLLSSIEIRIKPTASIEMCYYPTDEEDIKRVDKLIRLLRELLETEPIKVKTTFTYKK